MPFGLTYPHVSWNSLDNGDDDNLKLFENHFGPS